MKNFNYNILIFIFVFYINKINCISDDAVRKYISLDDSYFTYTYREDNSGEKTVYIFTISNQICFEFILLDDDDSSSFSGKIDLYNKDNVSYTISSQNINKNDHFTYYPLPNEPNSNFYIEWTYPKKHKIVINFRFYVLNLNLHKYNFDLKYSEYNLYNDENLFISIPLNDLKSTQYLSIKVTGDLKDSEIKYNEGYQTDIPKSIGQQGYDATQKLQYIKLSNDTYIFYYKILEKQDKNNIVLSMVGKNYNQNTHVASIKISVIYRQDIQSSIFGSNFKYSGNYIAANLNNFNLKEDIICIIYTNITNILDVYGIENSKIEDYQFGSSSGVDIYSNEKVSVINLSQEKTSKNIDTIIFEIKNAEESYNFQLIFVSNSEYNVELNNYDARQEKIQFIREIDSSNFILNNGKKNIIINNYSSSNEKYLHFIDLFYGDVKYAIANLDTENFVDILESQYSVSPHVINGSVEIKYLYAEKNFYGYNEYFIKCDSHNETNLNLGEFIIICLENNNKTEIYMPSGSFLYSISLPIQQNIEETYKIEFNNVNEKRTLSKNDKEYQSTWDYSKSNKITIENNNDYYVIVFLKTELNSGINKINESISGSTNLESKTLYALQLPKNSKNGEIYGVFQEIFSDNQISNICIFYSIIKNEFFSLPPDASCYNSQNNSFNLNVTSHGIKDKLTDNQEYFYTFIYFNSQSSYRNINLFYKHMIISQNMLEPKTFLIPPSYNIIYYQIDKKTDNTMLFVEIIPKEVQTNVYPISIENKNTTLFTFFKTIEILNYSDKSSYVKLININDKTPYLKIWDITIETLFLYDVGNKFTYNYINDKTVFSEIIEAEPRDYYLLNFKPFETDGSANYDIYIFNSSSGYTLNELNNTYYIYKNFLVENSSKKINYHDKISFNSIKSNNGDFDENIKEQFKLNLTGPKKTVFDILVISQKENPSSYKIYNAYEIILDRIINRKKINLNTTLEQTYCFNREILTDEKFILTITKISDDSSLKDGSLIIQLINKNNSISERILNIYTLREGSDKIYTSSGLNSFSYILNTEKVGNIFDITYEGDSEIEIKMCLEFIPSSGKKEFNEIIEYKYMTSVNLTYYVDTSIENNILEIFRFNYDQSKIKTMTIYTDFYDSNKIKLLSEKFEENYLKEIEDNKKYLGVYSTLNKTKICITVCIEVKSNYDINENLDSFYIERMQTIDNTNNLEKIEITIGENPIFYIYNLNSILIPQETLLFFTDLINKGLNIYRNNYFSKKYEQISLPLYPFTLSNETNTTTENGDVNILTLVTYNKKGSEDGFIDFSKKNEKYVVGENCDKEEFFNSKLELNYDQIYFLCYHENPINKKYNVTYTIEGPKNNIIYTHFSNKVLSQSSLSDINLEISNSRLKESTNESNSFNIINENSNLDIFKYFYFRRLNYTSNNIIIFTKWKYDEKQDTTETEEEYEDEENTDHGALIFAIMFLSTFIVVIGIFSIKNVNEKSKSNLSEKSNSSGTLDNSSFLSKSKLYKMN